MANLSISKAWDETKATLASDGKLLATVVAAMILLPQVVLGVISGQQGKSSSPPGATLMVLTLVAGLVAIVGQLAIAWLAIGRRVSVGEAIGHGLRRALPFFGAVLLLAIGLILIFFVLIGILMAAGVVDTNIANATVADPAARDVAIIMIVMLVPILFIAVRLMPTVPVAAAEQVGPIAIIKRSWALTAGNFWRLFGFLVMFLIAALIVAAVVGVIAGLLVTTLFGGAEPYSLGALVLALLVGLLQAALVLVYIVMLARIYVQLAGDRSAEASVPTSGS